MPDEFELDRYDFPYIAPGTYEAFDFNKPAVAKAEYDFSGGPVYIAPGTYEAFDFSKSDVPSGDVLETFEVKLEVSTDAHILNLYTETLNGVSEDVPSFDPGPSEPEFSVADSLLVSNGFDFF